MKISIITVCYNAESTIESAVRSVLDQDYPDVEYIVIDGKSTDRTLSILDRYRDKIARLISEKDEGIYFAINKGINLARGEAVGLLHADDFYPGRQVLSRVVSEFSNKNTDSVYGDLQYVQKNSPDKIFRNWKSRPFDPGLFRKGWMPPHPSFFVKRSCYLQYGLYNTAFTISADYELMLRFLYKHRISSSYIPEVLVKMRTGGISNVTWKSRLRANREDRLAWKINGLKPAPFTFILKPLSKMGQFL